MSGSQGRYLSPPGSQSGFSPKVNANLPLSTLPFLPSPPPIIGFQHLEQHGQPKITNALQVAYDSIPSRLPSRYDSVSPIHANYGRPPNSGIRMPQQTFAPIEESTSLRDRVRLGMGNGGGVVSRAHNGYTPVEQRMIQQAQSRRQGPTRLAAGPLAAANYQTMSDLVGPGMAGSIRGSTYRLTDFGNAMTEEDFHAGASGYEFTSPTLDVGHFGTGSALGSAVCSPAIEQTRSFASPRFSLDDISAKISFNRQRNQTDSSRTRTQLGPQTQMHTRSTTLPPHSLNSDRASGRSGIISSTHSHLVNPSPPSNTRDYTDIESTTNRMGGLYLGGSPTDSSRPQDRGAAVGPSSRAVVDNSQPHFPKNNRPYDSRSINSSIHSHQRNDTSNSQFPDGTNAADTVKSDAHTPNNITTHTSPMHNPMNTGNSLSLPNSHAEHLNSLGAHTPDNLISPMHSPALTHTPQTPATLSPATPFSTFSEPFTVSRSGNGKVEVGLGMHVGVAHATGLEVVRDDHGKTREMAVSQDGQATKNAT